MAQTKSNLHKKTITNKPKLKNKKVNKLELTVRLHENPIKTKIKALVAGGVLKLMLALLNVNERD
ncbi:hypothetical protein SKUN_00794 [Spiroplasma kunkelii CR2-3x]|uniref:Uncharacterized protein n=1 Tax=Spiroplasma kunkelii CR2-3x TaxID=273035 RepID=A0A0K2JGG6_SPIKU|nr:hypothetical protein [Spiroplasma kunkelii]ALA97684.1 hypothetical protein SKUN_00794 [Spiroplasma kunkelii CR2-3x]